jgi:hypothetical protein
MIFRTKIFFIICIFIIPLYPIHCFVISDKDSSQTKNEIFDCRIQLAFGLFLPSINSTAQLNAETGRIGTIINLETAFSLPETQNLFRMNGVFRFDNRHSVEAYYYALNRSGSNVSKDSLVFGDIIFRINSSFNAFFNATLFGGKYRYSIFSGETVEAGFSAGLSFLDIGVGAEVTFQNNVASDEYNDLLFLPVLGFYNRVNIIEDLIFRSNVDMFALDIGKYDGVLFDFGVSLEYLPYQLFSLGISYNVFSLNINFETGQTGKILYSHKGFMFFGKVYFN